MPDGGVPWSSWRDRPLYVQEGDGVGARSVSGEGWALSLGQSPPGGLCVGSDGGRQRPLISAKSNPPSHRRSRNRVRQGRRRNDPRQAHRRGYPESGDREPRTTNVADHGHDLDRLAIGGLLAPFAEEKSASSGRRQAVQQADDPVGAARWLGGWAGMVVWSGWAACLTHVVPALVAFALCNLGVRSTYRRERGHSGYWNGEVV